MKTLKEKGLTHSLKKAPGGKKRKKNADKEASGDAAEGRTGASDQEKKKEKKATTDSGIKNASTAYLAKRVLEEQDERNKRRKMEQNDNVKSLFSKNGAVKPAAGNSADYMTRGFSIGKK